MSAHRVNSRSRHTLYNRGYELSLAKRFPETEVVLRPIANPHVDGPSNTFVYAMVLYNSNRCPEASGYIESALNVVEQLRNGDGPRNTARSLDRTKSNLLVAKAYCTKDVVASGQIMYDRQIMYDAVHADPSN